MRWRRQGLRLCWRWKSRPCKPGRPPIKEEIRDLIRQMSRENSTWGTPRIESELRLLGIDVAERTVAKYMVRKRKPPTQTWRTFLNNHLLEVTDINILEVVLDTPSVLPFRDSSTCRPMDLSHPVRHDRWGR